MVNYQPAEEGPCGVNLKTLPSNGDLNSKPPHIKLFPQCTQPLTPRNAHAPRYEFSKWRTGQRGKLKNTKRFCNEFSTYTLVRKANPRKKDTKLYDIEIDMILNRYRGPV